jgi:hypothetical protein
MSAHYSIGSEIKSMDDLRAIFPTGRADERNWCLLSTSGVHGTYQTLDEAGRVEDDGHVVPHEITVLVIQPRLVCMRCGHIPYEPEDEPWLRKLVSSSLAAITASQVGNTVPPYDPVSPEQRRVIDEYCAEKDGRTALFRGYEATNRG